MIVVTQDYVARMVGIVNLLYGGIGALLPAALLIFVLGQLIFEPENRPDGLYFPYWFKFSIIALGFITTLPALAVGYGLLAAKHWAKPCRYVSSVFVLPNFPFGTAVAVYTIWVSLVDDGENVASIRYGTTRSQ